MKEAEELAVKLYEMAADMDAPDYMDTSNSDITRLTSELVETRERCTTLYRLLETIGGVL